MRFRACWIVHVLLVLCLTACVAGGRTSRDVFPPSLSIQELTSRPDGQWHLSLRIQNNSSVGMKFSKLDGLLKVTASMPIRMHADFDLDIPATSGDVLDMDVLPTDAMSTVLKSIANKGSAAGLAYVLEGRITAIPEKASQSRDFQFKGDGWLSPVPGLVNIYR